MTLPRYLLLLCFTAILSLAIVAEATGCSPKPIQFSGADEQGHRLPVYGASDYAFLAEVVEGVKQETESARIRVRVSESWTGRASVGEVLELGSYHWGPMCKRARDIPIRLNDYPIGTRVRFISGDLEIRTWERRSRLVIVPDPTAKKPE